MSNLSFVRTQEHNKTIPLDNFIGTTRNVALALTRVIAPNTNITPGTFKALLNIYNRKGFRSKNWRHQRPVYYEAVDDGNNIVVPLEYNNSEREALAVMEYLASRADKA